MRGLALILLLSACTDGREYAQAVCVLADTSGTYADELDSVTSTVRRALLPRMLPGDSLIVIRIDGDSYEKGNVEQVLSLDQRPSIANAQKMQALKALDGFGKRVKRSRHASLIGIDLNESLLTQTLVTVAEQQSSPPGRRYPV